MNPTKQTDDPLARLWAEAINLPEDGRWLTQFLARPDAKSHPVSNVKEAMERVLAAGVSLEDLGRVGRAERYETCFCLLYALDDPGLKSGKLAGLNRALVEARPGTKGKPVREKTFFKALWDTIDLKNNGQCYDEWASEPATDEPFGDTNPALKRLLQKGVTAADLGRLGAWHRYEATRLGLQLLAECFEEAAEACGLQEDILMSDPSGKEGRPGSWPLPPEAERPNRKARANEDAASPCLVLTSVENVTWLPGEDHFVAWPYSGRTPARIHDLVSGKARLVVKETRGFNWIGAMSDGKRFVASLRRSLAMVDVETGKKLKEVPWKRFSCPSQYARDVVLITNEDENGEWTTRCFVCVLDPDTLKQVTHLEVDGLVGKIHDYEFNSDSTRLALLLVPTDATALQMTIWSWPAMRCLARWSVPHRAFSLAPDGSQLVLCGENGVSLVDALTGEALWCTGEKHPLAIASRDWKWIVSSDGEALFSIWDIPGRRKVRAFHTKHRPDGFSISPGNARLAVTSSGDCIFWDFRRLVAG